MTNITENFLFLKFSKNFICILQGPYGLLFYESRKSIFYRFQYGLNRRYGAGDLGMTGIITFFAGHICSDLAWYSFVSYGVQFGGKFASLKVIKSILLVCGIFLIVFGIFFIIKGNNFIR